MSLPKEPRQKMINIMYIVLTALLALNVSSEILNAFKTIEQSLNSASNIIERKNADIYKSLKRKLADPKSAEKAAIWAPKAEKAHAFADAMYTYVESLKKELKVESGLKIKDGKEEYKEDDLDATTRLFLNDKSGVSKGKDLYNKLVQFKADLSAIDPIIAKEVLPNLPLDLSIPTTTSIAGKDDWAYAYFHMTPSVAAITILTKFQNDIRNSEAQVVEFCHKEIGEVELIYDQFNAFAASNSQYLMKGEELVITAGVGAFSSAAKPSISIDGVNLPITADGSAIYKSTAGAPGINSKRVRISFLKPNGETAIVEKDVKFTVGTPVGLVVSTDKTRVFYKGLDNPLTITGGGGAENINVAVEGAGSKISKASAGQYIVNCSQLGIVTVNVNSGKYAQKISIPVKRVPDPIPVVIGTKPGGSVSGNMPANTFRIQTGVGVELKDFIFDGVKFTVLSFNVFFTGKGFEEMGIAEVNGPAFAGEVKSLMRRCQPGTTVTIAGIKVLEPGGGTRELDQTITFILQ